MSETPTILIQTVGTGGDKNPVWEALAYVVAEMQPHILLQICSVKTEQETLPKFQKALSHRAPEFECEQRTYVLKDEDNVESSLGEIVAQIDALRAEFPVADIRIDFTSGTKAMSGAAVAAAVGRQLSQLYYATGPRDASGRVTYTDDVVKVGTDEAYGDLALLELGRMFDQGQFDAVYDQALRLLPRLAAERLRSRASSLVFMADVYRYWDLFNYKRASSYLRNFRELHKHNQYLHLPQLSRARLEASGCKDAGWDLEQLERQKKLLGTLSGNHDGVSPLVDLWENSDRRIQEGRFDDAVARLYRLTEYIGQVRFCKLTNTKYSEQNPTRRVPSKTIESYAPGFINTCLNSSKKPEHDLGLNNLVQFLAQAGDPIGQVMRRECTMEQCKEKGKLGELLQKRNESLLAHGKIPVEQQTAEKLLALLESYLRAHAEDLGCDFDAVKRAAAYLRCPWTGGSAPSQ